MNPNKSIGVAIDVVEDTIGRKNNIEATMVTNIALVLLFLFGNLGRVNAPAIQIIPKNPCPNVVEILIPIPCFYTRYITDRALIKCLKRTTRSIVFVLKSHLCDAAKTELVCYQSKV